MKSEWQQTYDRFSAELDEASREQWSEDWKALADAKAALVEDDLRTFEVDWWSGSLNDLLSREVDVGESRKRLERADYSSSEGDDMATMLLSGSDFHEHLLLNKWRTTLRAFINLVNRDRDIGPARARAREKRDQYLATVQHSQRLPDYESLVEEARFAFLDAKESLQNARAQRAKGIERDRRDLHLQLDDLRRCLKNVRVKELYTYHTLKKQWLSGKLDLDGFNQLFSNAVDV